MPTVEDSRGYSEPANVTDDARGTDAVHHITPRYHPGQAGSQVQPNTTASTGPGAARGTIDIG